MAKDAPLHIRLLRVIVLTSCATYAISMGVSQLAISPIGSCYHKSSMYSNSSLYTDFNAKDNAGNTPLHIAVECDAYEALDYLLSM